MRTSIRGLFAATLLAGTALAATPAFADETDAPSEFTLSGSAAIVSDYRFRGVSQSGGDIAVQGAIGVTHSSGVYVGTWASSLEEGLGYGSTEVDIYAGWKGEVGSGITADVGVTYYAYPNSGVGDDLNFFEPYVKLSTTVGPISATAGVAYAWEQDALGGSDNLYLFGDASAAIPNTPITLSGHVGYTDGFLTFMPDGNAFDWSVGASYAITPKLSLGVSYVGVEAATAFDNGPAIYTDDTAVVSLTLTF